jgi:transposase-like protein
MFPTQESCYVYLTEKKWGNGYKCRRCGNQTYYMGRKEHWRKCQSCLYDESPTAQTLFHKLKFDIRDAFFMMYRIAIDKKGASSLELQRETGIRQKTCWYFKRKIQQAMVDNDPVLLTGTVEVDECIVGGRGSGKRGRSVYGSKKIAMIMVENVTNKKGQTTMGNGYAARLERFSAEDLFPLMHKHLDPNAYISADQWSGYKSLQNQFPNMYQIASDKGKNFPLIHLHIMNIKHWIRGIHHHCSDKHFQAYLNEYHFRFNRRQNRAKLFDRLVANMIAAVPLYITLNEICA